MQMRSKSPLFLLLANLLIASVLTSCGLLPDKIDKTSDWSASKIYSEAKSAMNDGDYTQAIEYYDLVLARFPFGKYAQQSQIDIAYAHYKGSEPDAALASLDNFIKTNPRHPHVDYAYYMKGLVNFTRGDSFITRFIPQDPSQRDPGAAREAFFDFETLTKRHPDSKYAEDARMRMLYLRNNLAQHEVNVARYYMKRGAFLAAANRAQYAIERFDKAPAIHDAIGILFRAYEALGMDELAENAHRVMELNYPEHPVLTGADKEDNCWLWLICV